MRGIRHSTKPALPTQRRPSTWHPPPIAQQWDMQHPARAGECMTEGWEPQTPEPGLAPTTPQKQALPQAQMDHELLQLCPQPQLSTRSTIPHRASPKWHSPGANSSWTHGSVC